MPIHLLSHCCAPLAILDKIEKLCRGFLWGDKKLHLISWARICRPKACGGLGFKNLREWRKALLAKQAGRALLEPNSLWIKLVQAKYRGRLSGSSIWKMLLALLPLIEDGMRTMLRDGRNTSMLDELWVGRCKLAKWPTTVIVEAPNLGATVSELIDEVAGGGRRGWCNFLGWS